MNQRPDLDHIFTHHPPRSSQVGRYEAVRSAAKAFAQVVVDSTPAGADQSAAIRKIREAAMTANAAIALETETRVADAPAPLPVADFSAAWDPER